MTEELQRDHDYLTEDEIEIHIVGSNGSYFTPVLAFAVKGRNVALDYKRLDRPCPYMYKTFQHC